MISMLGGCWLYACHEYVKQYVKQAMTPAKSNVALPSRCRKGRKERRKEECTGEPPSKSNEMTRTKSANTRRYTELF
jgi:hypothetical protein